MTEYDSDDDMPPELEDMSATIAAARKMRYASWPRPARCLCRVRACARTPGHQLTVVRPHPLPRQRDAARRRAKARLRAVRGRRQRRRKASAGGGAACCRHAHQGRRTR